MTSAESVAKSVLETEITAMMTHVTAHHTGAIVEAIEQVVEALQDSKEIEIAATLADYEPIRLMQSPRFYTLQEHMFCTLNAFVGYQCLCCMSCDIDPKFYKPNKM